MVITKANQCDLSLILELQYLAYQSEAKLLNNPNIPPLKQTLQDVQAEYQKGIVLKALDEDESILGSVRAFRDNDSVYIGKLIVHPTWQRQGIGTRVFIMAHHLVESFLPEHVNAIHKKASDAGVSINSYIITAFLKAGKDLISVGMAVNARLDGNRTMSNQATGISVNYAYNNKISFEQNAKQVHKSVYKKLSKPVSKYLVLRFITLLTPSLIDSIMMYTYSLYENDVTAKLSKIMGYTSDSKPSFGITNLTKLDIPSVYNDCRIESLYFVPPVVSYSRQTVGIATIDSGMTVTYHCMNDAYKESMKDVFDDAMRTLLSN